MNFKGSDLDVAVNALIGSMLRCGYLSEITNSILVSVDSSDAAQGEALQKRIAAEIEAILNQNGGGSVLSQTVSHDAELEKLAAEYGITLGKAKLIQQITSASPLYTFESLVSLSINDLNLLMNSGKLNLGGIDRSGTPASGAYIGEEAANALHSNMRALPKAKSPNMSAKWTMSTAEWFMILSSAAATARTAVISNMTTISMPKR